MRRSFTSAPRSLPLSITSSHALRRSFTSAPRSLLLSLTSSHALRRSFTSAPRSLPLSITSSRGTVVPYPVGCTNPLGPTVYLAGEEVFTTEFDPDNPQAPIRQQARENYKILRPTFMLRRPGAWLAVDAHGNLVASDTQAKASAGAKLLFGQNHYYLNCVGSEVAHGIHMDSSEFPEVPLAEMKGRESIVWETCKGSSFVVKGDFSFDGKNYTSYAMKIDSGAALVGVPKEVYNDPKPSSVVLKRVEGPFVSINPRGKATEVHVYDGLYLKIGGLVTCTRIMEARTFLVGYPVISRFACTLNAKCASPVVLSKLEGEQDHTSDPTDYAAWILREDRIASPDP